MVDMVYVRVRSLVFVGAVNARVIAVLLVEEQGVYWGCVRWVIPSPRGGSRQTEACSVKMSRRCWLVHCDRAHSSDHCLFIMEHQTMVRATARAVIWVLGLGIAQARRLAVPCGATMAGGELVLQ